MSEIQDSCFKNFIGLSQTECACFGTPPSDYNTSLSNLYIDQLEGQQLRMQDALHDCKDGSLWMFLYNARQNAVKSVKADLIQGIASANKLQRIPFQGILGGHEQQSGAQPFDEVLAGRRWIMNPIRGGKVIVKGIWTFFDQTGSFPIALYNNLSDTALETINLDTTAGQWKYNLLPSPLALSQYDAQVSYMQYWWLFSPLVAGDPLRNQIHCGCGGVVPSYDCGYPLFPQNMDNIWNAFLMDLGTRGNVLADRKNWNTSLSEGYGLRFDVQMYCNVEQTICTSLMDFQSSELPYMISQMLQFKSGYYVNSYLLALPEPTTYTTVNREQLEADRSFYFKQYTLKLAQTIERFSTAENLKLFSDCFTCDNGTSNSFRKQGILI